MSKMKQASLIEFDLAKYSKSRPEEREQAWTTSVNLTQRHRIFLEKSNVNFSELVRDFIDALILKGSGGE